VDVLKATEELRELFIGVLAHDLSNPLSAILSAADLMLRRGALPEVEYKATARIASLLDATGSCVGEWDPDRLAQLVGNLVANAIDHGDPDTPGRARAPRRGRHLRRRAASRRAFSARSHTERKPPPK
jgi:signal transduction histidine kinase